MGEGVGLARAGAGNDQQWSAGRAGADAMLDRTALLGVQAMEVVDLGEHGRIKRNEVSGEWTLFSFCSQSG